MDAISFIPAVTPTAATTMIEKISNNHIMNVIFALTSTLRRFLCCIQDCKEFATTLSDTGSICLKIIKIGRGFNKLV